MSVFGLKEINLEQDYSHGVAVASTLVEIHRDRVPRPRHSLLQVLRAAN